MTFSGPLTALLLLVAHGVFGVAGVSRVATFGEGPKLSDRLASRADPSPDAGRIGIGLLGPTPDQEADKRAQDYVVDHVGRGADLTRRFEISSTSSVRQRVSVYAGAASIHGNAFTLAPGRTQNELTSWISVDRPVLDLPPHSRRTAAATFHIPESAETGERYAVIWAEVSSLSPGSQGNLRLISRVGVRVYLDVGPGSEPPSGLRIESLAPGRTHAGRPMVRARVHNTGQRAIDLSGQLTLDGGPRGSAPVRLPAGRGTTLAPGRTTFVVVVLDSELSAGPWRTRLVLESGRVSDDATADLTFPLVRGGWGPATGTAAGFPTRLALASCGLALLGLLAVASVVARRRGRAKSVLHAARPALSANRTRPISRGRAR